MKWPFGNYRAEHQATAGAPASQIVPATMTDLHALQLAQMEIKIKSLEQCVVMLAQGIRTLAEAQNQNIMVMQKQFQDLAQYVMRPRASIMGDQQEKN